MTEDDLAALDAEHATPMRDLTAEERRSANNALTRQIRDLVDRQRERDKPAQPETEDDGTVWR